MFSTLIPKWLTQIIGEERLFVYVNLRLIFTAKETPSLNFMKQSCLVFPLPFSTRKSCLSPCGRGKEVKIYMTACLSGTSNVSEDMFSDLVEICSFYKFIKILTLQHSISKLFQETRINLDTDVLFHLPH